MPLSVVASSGDSYHLFQLSLASFPEIEDSLEISVLDNELTDGYRHGIQCGFDAGTRSWKLTFPSLAAGEIPVPSVSGPSGESISREQYLRTLYAEQKVTSTPFVFTDPQSGTYYFADFEDKSLSMKRLRNVKIYGAGVVIRQQRISGVYIP